ncbi:MAG: hypothetical protein MUO43_13160, partial [Desulfobacterales bacterium]|nr:hypothetical protein [Desulfobacterales bacterium]
TTSGRGYIYFRHLPVRRSLGEGGWPGYIRSATCLAPAINNKIALMEEPTGSRLEYRVRAVNKGGESSPSNTVSVVL